MDARSVGSRSADVIADSTALSNADSLANVPTQMETVFGAGYAMFTEIP